jgi:hypothetical protein
VIRRTTKVLLEITAGLIAFAAIVAGVLVWRVSQGPVELNFLTPRLERALAQGGADMDVSIGGTVLAWEGWPETFAVRLQNIRISAQARSVARIPSLDLRLSLPALLNGTIAPTRVEGRAARLTVIRGPDGLRFATDPPPAPSEGADAQSAPDVSTLLPRLLDDLMADPAPARPLSYLEQLSVSDARVIVRDEILDRVWVAPNAQISLRRAPGGIDGTAEMTLRTGGQPVGVDAAIGYARGSGRIDVVAGFDELRPGALAGLLPQLEDAGGLDLPLQGTVSASLALSGKVTAISANVTGGPGRISWPTYLPDPRPVRGLEAQVHYTAAGDRVRLNRLEIDFGAEAGDGDAAADGQAGSPGTGSPRAAGPVITASATASGLSGSTEVAADLQVQGLDLDRLGDYWPVGLGGNARPWVVENIRTGRARSAELSTRFRIPEDDRDTIRLDSLDGRIAYEGLDVHYLRPLQPVRGVSGTASFDADSFALDVAGGQLGPVQVTGADIEITGLDTTDHRIAISLGLNGPLRRALDVLDQPRLDLIRPLGLSPGSVSGRIDRADLSFRFPLIAELTFDQTEVRAEASLSEVSVADFVLGQDARDGAFELVVDKAGMKLDGGTELGGVPLTMTWRERFQPGDGPSTTVEALVDRLSTADRSRLGLDTRPFIDGPVAASLIAQTYPNGDGVVNATVNLNEAGLKVPFAGWSKPPGEPGTASASLRLDDGEPIGLDSFSLDAGGGRVERVSASGTTRFAEGPQAIQRVELARFRLGRTDLNGMTVTRSDAGWRLQLDSGTLDLARLLGEGVLESGEPGQEPAAGAAIEIAQSRLNRVYFAPERYVDDVVLSAQRGADGWWRRLRVDGRAPARFRRAARADGSLPPAPPDATPAPFEISYTPMANGRRQVLVNAEDSGAMLRALDLFDNVEGGRMRVSGQSRGPAPQSPVDARVEVSEFKLVNAPTLARILTIASFTGINNLLQGEGISFQRLDGDATYNAGTLSTDLLHAYGPALGVTTKGSVNLDAEQLDLTGVVVPAASTNRVLGNIPVLGRLLTGGEGEGLFAVTYDVEGSFDEPDVSVNPLSALAPGFLRGLFGRLGELESDGDTRPWPRARPDR